MVQHRRHPESREGGLRLLHQLLQETQGDDKLDETLQSAASTLRGIISSCFILYRSRAYLPFARPTVVRETAYACSTRAFLPACAP
jgi:hypothetical protein